MYNDQIRYWMESNQLVCVTILVEKHGRDYIVGRIIQHNPERKVLLVYNDDHKKIHHLRYNEIDDINPVT